MGTSVTLLSMPKMSKDGGIKSAVWKRGIEMADTRTIIDDVRLALRISTLAFDPELNLLINAAKTDLGIAGVTLPAELDDICKKAIITYCKLNFGEVDRVEMYSRLKESYDEQKAQLSMATGYTTWAGSE